MIASTRLCITSIRTILRSAIAISVLNLTHGFELMWFAFSFTPAFRSNIFLVRLFIFFSHKK
jgi:hypothetical protein